MPRLKFDVQPVDRSEGHYQTQEENDAWVAGLWDRWERPGEPSPCNCGYYADKWLVTCDEVERRRCAKDVRKRLEYGARQSHLRSLRKKREFPGPPHDGKGVGWCRWCGTEIINAKSGARDKRRTWCADGGCLKEYNLRVFHVSQRRFLKARDGDGCKKCTADEWCEVDHVIALSAAWEAFGQEPGRFRWFFGPPNLQLLCGACHRAKTKDDIALIRACQKNGPQWAKAEVLRRLKNAGLLRIRRAP